MSSKILKYILSLLLMSHVKLVAQDNNIKSQINFFGVQVYSPENNNYILKMKDYQDNYSRIESNFFYSAGEWGKTQYSMELRYLTNFSRPDTSSLILRQMYVKIPLKDFCYLVIGKRQKNFGVAYFHNFSNRLSPKEIFYERIERLIPAIIEYDWIISPIISFESILCFNKSGKWKDVSMSEAFEISLDRFYGDIHIFYENQKQWLTGINMIYQFDIVKLYTEAIIKDKSDQIILKNNKQTWRNGNQLSLSAGIEWQWDIYSINFEYAYRSEGYNDVEKRDFINFVKSTNIIRYYNRDYFDRHYFGTNLNVIDFPINNVSFRIRSLFSLNDISGYLLGGISYLHRDTVDFGFYGKFYTGNTDGEYILFSPDKYQLFCVVNVAF